VELTTVEGSRRLNVGDARGFRFSVGVEGGAALKKKKRRRRLNPIGRG
jgi:hypothetical protein